MALVVCGYVLGEYLLVRLGCVEQREEACNQFI